MNGWSLPRADISVKRNTAETAILSELAKTFLVLSTSRDESEKLHCTTSVIVDVCVIVVLPDVAVALTVTVVVPAGVPGFAGALLPEPPPPHPKNGATAQKMRRSRNRLRLRRRMPTNASAASEDPAKKKEPPELV